MHIIIGLIAVWWVLHFLGDLFGGTPGAHKHKTVGRWDVGTPLLKQDFKEDSEAVRAYLSAKEKAVFAKAAMIGLIVIGVMIMGAVIGAMYAP